MAGLNAALSEAPDHVSPGAALLKVSLVAGLAVASMVGFSRMASKQSHPLPGLVVGEMAPPVSMMPAFPAEATSRDQGPNRLSREDVAFLNSLSMRLQQPSAASPSEADTERIEKMFASHSDDQQLRAFLIGIHFRRAGRDLETGSFSLVDQSLARLKAIDDQQPQIYEMEAYARARRDDWAGALAAAQKYDSLAGEGSLSVSFTLAASLQGLGRNAEALAVLDRPVFQSCPTARTASDQGACRFAQQLRAALTVTPATTTAAVETRRRAALNVDPSKDLIQSERFDVRYDGENQSGVARDVLFVLDRAYARLADIYYDRPTRKIPVVLHAGQSYFSATGAPWWSGGVYSSHTGAIQIPVRGLPSTLPREMEDVLVHELSHAFVDEMSGGRAGRDLQEGLAQYMEGKRIEQELGLSELKRLANSGGQNVMSFYMLSLAVTEALVQSRGQGMINDLLRAIKETGSEEAGFKKVFGQTGVAMKRDILETFWRRYS